MAAKPSRIDFLDQVEYLIQTKFPLVKLERSEPEFAIRINGHWTRLENLYRLHVHAPENLEEHVNRWVVELLRASEGSPDRQAEFEDVKDRILPMVLSEAPRDVAGLAMVKQKLLHGLNVAYAIDSERTI